MIIEMQGKRVEIHGRNFALAIFIAAFIEFICEVLSQNLGSQKSQLYIFAAIGSAIYLSGKSLSIANSRKYIVLIFLLQALLIIALDPFNAALSKLLPALLIPMLAIFDAGNSRFRYLIYVVVFLFDILIAISITSSITHLTSDPLIIVNAIFQTNPREAFDYIISIGPIPPMIIIAISGLLIVAKLRIKSKASKISRALFVVSVLMFPMVVRACYLITIDPFVSAITNKVKDVRQYKSMSESRPKYEGAYLDRKDCCQTHVVIIGETMNRHHMELFGYGRHTTPNLSKLKSSNNFFAFDDVISPEATTMASLERVLTNSTNDSYVPFNRSISVIQMLRSADMEVDWLSNQIKMGIWDHQVGVIAEGSNSTLYLNIGVKESLPLRKDEELLSPLTELLAKKTSKNRVIFVHLIGCHANYTDRYPEKFMLFNGIPPNEGSDLNKVNMYDDCVAYNDYVVGNMMDIFKKNNVATALYFSDHGEDVDFGNEHISDLAKFRTSMVEIPMALWLSEDYIKNHKQLYAQISRSTHRKFMMDGLYNSLFDLYGVRSKEYDPTKSIFNKKYVERHRRTLAGKYAYD